MFKDVPKENYYDKYEEPYNGTDRENQDFKDFGFTKSAIDFTLIKV
jgi:hypothetical protein